MCVRERKREREGQRVCVCVYEREKKREKDRERREKRKKEREQYAYRLDQKSLSPILSNPFDLSGFLYGHNANKNTLRYYKRHP